MHVDALEAMTHVVMWLNPVDEHLAKGWKKGQGPPTACLGEQQSTEYSAYSISMVAINFDPKRQINAVFDASIVLLCLDKKLKRKENKVMKPSLQCIHNNYSIIIMTMQVVQELAVAEDDIRFKMLLPCAKCSVYDLPDSDGMCIISCKLIYAY